jgi:hypothetical protein
MDNQLFIPQKINVGLQGRNDTYTGKLGYVIYWDNKGKLRKEGSWESWRWKEGDKKNIRNDITGKWEDIICGPEYAAKAFDNVPTEGFVLNKDVGGARRSYGWDARIEKVRVYDPRNFEFEISIPNLLFILQETSAIKGKGLEGEFVYAWSGKELVLLPVGCKEYKNSAGFTDLQSKKVTKTDILPGCLYKTKKQVDVMYLGRYNWCEIWTYRKTIDISPKHIFYDVKSKIFYQESGFTTLGERLTTEVAENYSDILEEYQNSKYFSIIKDCISKPSTIDGDKLIKDGSYYSAVSYICEDNTYYQVQIYLQNDYTWRPGNSTFKGFRIVKKYRIDFNSGKLNYVSLPNNERSEIISLTRFKDLTFMDLYLILNNGIEININEYFK